MLPTDALAKLKEMSGAFEAYHRMSYVCHRTRRDGTIDRIDVDILDAGPHEPLRYSVHARSKVSGKTAGGNSHASLEAALALVHWGDLDFD